MLLASLLNTGIISYSQLQTDKQFGQLQRANHTLRQADLLISSLKDAETGQRGFLLTQNPSYLQPYFDGIATSRAYYDELTKLTQDTPNQVSKLQNVKKLIEKKLAELDQTIALSKQGKHEEALTVVNADHGKQFMASIRTEMESFIQREQALLVAQTRNYENMKKRVKLISLLTGAVVILLVITGAYILNRLAVMPLSKLLAKIEGFGTDKDEPAAAVKGFKEIARLSEAFDDADRKILNALNESRHAAKVAQDANRAKGDFLSNMSHEIRNPLNGIYGILQLLSKNEQLDSEARDLLSKAVYSTKSLGFIINDILDFSKIESRALRLEEMPFSFDQIVAQTQSEIGALAKEKSVKITSKPLAKDVDGWLGDPTRVKQILLNLLSNGVKFAKGGRVDINAWTEHLDGKIHLCFSVDDNGVGMDQETLSRLFNRFEQASASTSRRFGGSGLGLAITKALVEMMDGSIEVTSEIHKGTSVKVRLPLEHSDIQSPTQDLTGQIDAPSLEGKNILLVEDNDINQVVFESMMEQTGADIKVAVNGRQGIEFIEQSIPDLVFMDIFMPEMGGIEACQLIKEKYPNLPIVALTANVMEHEVRHYEEVGFDGCLGKPLDWNQLNLCLNRYFS
ncbi:CHASE3 domain-containing protein [Bermanella marisrubri]|uniref:CHASE3 domain-containing protein n=1 Tax=Bermanella marisrubri TaxID=207949 RepID=UPI001B30E43A|nr:CHASE3 domain-containing protein [Bermanella marisrubri]